MARERFISRVGIVMASVFRDPNPRAWTRRWRLIRRVLEESLRKFFNEDSLAVSASMAYHSLLCIFPFLLLFTEISGFYIRHRELTGRLALILERYLPMRADFIVNNLQSISSAYGKVGIISFLLLLWGSSGIFLPLEKALNRAWEAQHQRSWLRRKLLALGMAVVVGFLLLASSTLVGVNVYVHRWLQQGAVHSPSVLLSLAYHLLIMVTTFGLTLTMFVVIFKLLPNRPMHFSQVLPSALLTAIFWEGARSLFTLLLPVFNYRHVYGSIGVVVALMTWAYLSSVVVLFGAQISGTLYRTLEAAKPAGEPGEKVADARKAEWFR
ncbi:MAG: YihY/virulence factor BrkB family protein [Acidobacteriia bacterium]|nr:YihY/virulence factor BrkB family protein [Terriglobia bacterium]